MNTAENSEMIFIEGTYRIFEDGKEVSFFDKKSGCWVKNAGAEGISSPVSCYEKNEKMSCPNHDMKVMTFNHNMGHNMNHDMTYDKAEKHHSTRASFGVKNQTYELSKSDWLYLVQTLENWGVFAPKAIIKRYGAGACWEAMIRTKDFCPRVPGAYFTKVVRSLA